MKPRGTAISDKPDVARFADMLAAMGAEPRLRIVRLLLAAHPRGMVVGDIQAELGIPGSTLSHHLEKLRHEGIVKVHRDRQFLWYQAETKTLRELVDFLYAECCTRGGGDSPLVRIQNKEESKS